MCHPLLSSDAGEDSHWAGCQVEPEARAHLTRVQATAALSTQCTSKSLGWDTASRPGLGEVERLVVSTETGSDPAQESEREVTLPILLLLRSPGHCFKRGACCSWPGPGAGPAAGWAVCQLGLGLTLHYHVEPICACPPGHDPSRALFYPQITSDGTFSQGRSWGTEGIWLPLSTPGPSPPPPRGRLPPAGAKRKELDLPHPTSMGRIH